MSDVTQSNCFVITGTSGSGKTSVINALKSKGHQCFDEPVRDILTHQLSIDGPALPSKDSSLFIQELLNRFTDDYHQSGKSGSITYFDRGIPDTIAYARRFMVDCKVFELASGKFKYNKTVFILPPWKAIFTKDSLRKDTFENYLNFHEQIKFAYQSSGYKLVEVPIVDLQSRVDFIENETRRLSSRVEIDC